jgi:hypothetical protein
MAVRRVHAHQRDCHEHVRCVRALEELLDAVRRFTSASAIERD